MKYKFMIEVTTEAENLPEAKKTVVSSLNRVCKEFKNTEPEQYEYPPIDAPTYRVRVSIIQ